MKKFNVLISMIMVVTFFACNNNGAKKNISTDVVQNSKSAEPGVKPYKLPKMEFTDTTYDFGRIIQGEKVAYDFRFTNIGRSDLVISKVRTSCGCTVGKYPKHPIKPGEKGKIEVVFDSKSKRGFQNKTITVMANTQPNYTRLFLKGVVVEPEKN